jgi:hypothetical protein
VLGEMLDDEVAAAKERLGSRALGIRREDASVTLGLGGDLSLVLDGSRYDVEPVRVSVVDAEANPVAHERWPGSLSLGVHPILGRPFACVQGTYEYHAHPSHLEDHWARYRNSIRLPDLLDHLLRKAGL